jgi:hypothetical protein
MSSGNPEFIDRPALNLFDVEKLCIAVGMNTYQGRHMGKNLPNDPYEAAVLQVERAVYAAKSRTVEKFLQIARENLAMELDWL